MKKIFGFLKTTAIGGLLFLFPLIVIGALLGQAIPLAIKGAEAVGKVLPVKTPAGIAGLVVLAIIGLLLMCFFAGLVARRRFAKKILKGFEKNLLLLFPRYAIFKDQVAGTLGTGEGNEPRMKPVLAKLTDMSRIGFEVERGVEFVTVYFPGAPDPWAGEVALIATERVQALSSDFGKTVAAFEKLGRDTLSLAAETQDTP